MPRPDGESCRKCMFFAPPEDDGPGGACLCFTSIKSIADAKTHWCDEFQSKDDANAPS